jgi:hypothetical protein
VIVIEPRVIGAALAVIEEYGGVRVMMAHYDQLTKLREPEDLRAYLHRHADSDDLKAFCATLGFGMMMLATFAEALAEHEEAS